MIKVIILVQQEIHWEHAVQQHVFLLNVCRKYMSAFLSNLQLIIIPFLATSERLSPTRRQYNSSAVSSTVKYQQQQSSGSTQPAASYRVYAHSEPSPSSYQAAPGTVVTQITEETQVIQIPSQQPQQQQYNEITYTVQDKQPKFEPVAFQVSTMKENIKPARTSAPAPIDNNDPNPFKIFGAKLKSRPNQGIVPSYEDQNTASYSQQTSSSTGSQYQQFTSQQPSSSSYPPTQPNFSKIR